MYVCMYMYAIMNVFLCLYAVSVYVCMYVVCVCVCVCVCVYACVCRVVCMSVLSVLTEACAHNVRSKFERTHKCIFFVFFVRVFLFHKYIFFWLKYKCALSVSVLSGLCECAQWFA